MAKTMPDRRIKFGADVGSDHFLDGSGADEKVDLESSGRGPNHGQVLHLATDERADDRHRMVHRTETADDDDITVFNEACGLILSGQHLSALGPIGASDWVKLHPSPSSSPRRLMSLPSSSFSSGRMPGLTTQHAIGVDLQSQDFKLFSCRLKHF